MVKSHNEMLDRINALGELADQLNKLVQDGIPDEDVLSERNRHLEGLAMALHTELESYKTYCGTTSADSRVIHRIGQVDQVLASTSEHIHLVWGLFMARDREIHMEKFHGVKRKEKFVN